MKRLFNSFAEYRQFIASEILDDSPKGLYKYMENMEEVREIFGAYYMEEEGLCFDSTAPTSFPCVMVLDIETTVSFTDQSSRINYMDIVYLTDFKKTL
jgi:hypothetical protein